ncbi:MAG TPA: hypothetical protein ENG47_00680 [Candidatus Aerophobetes bacterium]|uniref:PorV/PorQ family protein n=2 Tax=Aerophobetes bacterium TaxID=2030807 RepID=A0A7V0QQJ6_UNCAE|nr:hypothetical protein [Candidatus Aerophobetes bacterium]
MVRIRRRLGIAVFAGAVLILVGGVVGWANVVTDLQVGCRPQAMGGAFVAVADDVNASYWNPAGIAQINKGAFTFLHSNPYISELSLDYLSYLAPNSLSFIKGGFALSYLKQAGKLYQQASEGSAQVTHEMVAPEMYTLSVGGTAAANKLYYGLNFNGLAVSAETDTGKERRGGFSADIGILYKVKDNFSVGVVRKNMAASLGGEGFPGTLRAGFAGKLMNGKLLVAADFNSKEDVGGNKGTSWQSHFGVEYAITNALALRLGSDRGNFTAGFGFKFALPGKLAPNAALDYSYTSNSDLGSASRFSLTILFK